MALYVKYKVDNEDGTKTQRQAGPYQDWATADENARDIRTYVGISGVTIDSTPLAQ